MNQNELSEKLLLVHPDMRIVYLKKYELYKSLDLPLDLFFNEDIINYKEKFYNYNVNFTNLINMKILHCPIITNPYNTEIGGLLTTWDDNNTIYFMPASMIIHEFLIDTSYRMFDMIFTKQPLTSIQEKLIQNINTHRFNIV